MLYFRSVRFFLALIFAVVIMAASTAAAEADRLSKNLTFGVVPQQSATKLAQHWGPLLLYLKEKTGYALEFKTAKNIPTFEKRCAQGEYDFAYMNPYHYIVFHVSAGYQVFAKEKLKSLKGIIVVRKDSPIQSLEELNSKTLAFPSPAAFAASIITQTELTNRGIKFNAKYVSSHDSVYRSVEKGLYPAGGGVPRTFNNITEDVRSKLRILWTSAGFAPHAIAAHPRVPKEAVQKIQEALLALPGDPQGQKILESLEMNSGFEPATDEQYDDIKNLKIKKISD